MTQETLGAAIGLSFQMVQKYEVGLNSVPASRLFDLAKVLDVPPLFFFEGPRLRTRDLARTTGVIKLVRAYATISNSSLRDSIAEMIRAIAGAPLSRRARWPEGNRRRHGGPHRPRLSGRPR